METAEPVSMGLLVGLMVSIISLLTSIIILVTGFVIKGIHSSTSHSHQRIDELIVENNKEHTAIRNLCFKRIV